jgi:hypothetical protein
MNHIYEQRYEWRAYPEAEPADLLFDWAGEHVGLEIRVLANPSGMQVRNETALYLESANADIEKQDAYWQHIAPRIVDWNLYIRNEVGEEVKMPPPAERWESLLDLPISVQMWIRLTVHMIHRPKVLTTLLNPHGATDSIPSTTPVPESSPV